MKKFLTLEESRYLIDKCNINSDKASYVEKRDRIFDSIINEMVEYFNISRKDDCIIKVYNKNNELLYKTVDYDESLSRFSIGDLLWILKGYDIEKILHDMDWNAMVYGVEDDKELIDYLFIFIKENYESI